MEKYQISSFGGVITITDMSCGIALNFREGDGLARYHGTLQVDISALAEDSFSVSSLAVAMAELIDFATKARPQEFGQVWQ